MAGTTQHDTRHFEFVDEYYDAGDGLSHEDRKARNYPRRIRATRDVETPYGTIPAGTLGGYITTADNIEGPNAWVGGNGVLVGPDVRIADGTVVDGDARVWGKVRAEGTSHITDKASVCDEAHLSSATVRDNAVVKEKPTLDSGTVVRGGAEVSGSPIVKGATIEQGARVSGRARLGTGTVVAGTARVQGDARADGAKILDNATLDGAAHAGYGTLIHGNARVIYKSKLSGNARVGGDSTVTGTAEVGGDTIIDDHAYVGGDVKTVDGARIGGTTALVGTTLDEQSPVVVRTRDDGSRYISGIYFDPPNPQPDRTVDLDAGQVISTTLPGAEDVTYPPRGRDHSSVPDHHIFANLPDSGRYMAPRPDGTPAYYQVKKDSTGNNALFEVDKDTGKAMSSAPLRSGRAADIQRAINRDPETAMAEFGRGTGVCGKCGRALTDPTPQAAGLGPSCRR